MAITWLKMFQISQVGGVLKMATEILKIDASWAEEFTKTSEQILMTPTVFVCEAYLAYL